MQYTEEKLVPDQEIYFTEKLFQMQLEGEGIIRNENSTRSPAWFISITTV